MKHSELCGVWWRRRETYRLHQKTYNSLIGKV